MGAGHGHRLHFHAHSPLHRAAPEHKLVALLAFVLLVVATPATEGACQVLAQLSILFVQMAALMNFWAA